MRPGAFRVTRRCDILYPHGPPTGRRRLPGTSGWILGKAARCAMKYIDPHLFTVQTPRECLDL